MRYQFGLNVREKLLYKILNQNNKEPSTNINGRTVYVEQNIIVDEDGFTNQKGSKSR